VTEAHSSGMMKGASSFRNDRLLPVLQTWRLGEGRRWLKLGGRLTITDGLGEEHHIPASFSYCRYRKEYIDSGGVRILNLDILAREIKITDILPIKLNPCVEWIATSIIRCCRVIRICSRWRDSEVQIASVCTLIAHPSPLMLPN
jgi:hypothetical protein